MSKRLTEKQAWARLAELVREQEKDEYGEYCHPILCFYGLCHGLAHLGVGDTVLNRMYKKIRKLKDYKYSTYKWSVSSAYGRKQRIKFCLENAK